MCIVLWLGSLVHRDSTTVCGGDFNVCVLDFLVIFSSCELVMMPMSLNLDLHCHLPNMTAKLL